MKLFALYIGLLFTFFLNFVALSDTDDSGNETEISYDDSGVDDLVSSLEKCAVETFFFRKVEKISSNQQTTLSCLDENGEKVDWWFMYKEPRGLRYLYMSSKTAKTNKFQPLKNNRKLDDPQYSPLLRTIYRNYQRSEGSSEVWLGWNDHAGGDGKDAYLNNIDGVKHAHSKGFFAIDSTVPDPYAKNLKNKNRVISSYAILTSLPQFPNIPTSNRAQSNGVYKYSLPLKPADIFDKNVSANAQHFMCISFEHSAVTLDEKDEVPFNLSNRNLFEYKQSHINFLQSYLKTIHPAIVGTNFDDGNPNHSVWRNYFSLLKRPYKEAKYNLFNSNLNVQLKEYSYDDLPALGICDEYHESRLFPLSASPFYFTANCTPILSTTQTYTSRWGPLFASQNGCQSGNELVCTSSFTFKSTSFQSCLEGQLFAKHGLAVMDIYDDWATLQLVRSQSAFEYTYINQVVTKYGLLVQTWIDGKGALPLIADKKIYDQKGHVVSTVHVDNMGELKMPVEPNIQYQGGYRIEYPLDPIDVPSVSFNHSKIALGFPLQTFNTDYELSDANYSFNPLFFVGDLNRTYTQARLKASKQGRGGGILATGEWPLWSAIMLLNPRPQTPKFIANGTKAAKAMQKRLASHVASSNLSSTHISGFEVQSIRSHAFKCLGLSKSEGKRMPKAIPFTPFLNELSKFTRKAIHKSEYSAFDAFKRMYHKFEIGEVFGAADAVWEAQSELEKTEQYGHYKTNTLQSIPQLHLFREAPRSVDWSDDEFELGEVEREAPCIVRDEARPLELVTGSMQDSLFQLLSDLIEEKKKKLTNNAKEEEEEESKGGYQIKYVNDRILTEDKDQDDVEDDDWDAKEIDYGDEEEENESEDEEIEYDYYFDDNDEIEEEADEENSFENENESDEEEYSDSDSD